MLTKIQEYIAKNKSELKEQGLQIHDDHALPQSRRDLLAMGFYTAGYSMILPSLGSILLSSKEALASDCPPKQLPGGVPFFQVHASGGWLTGKDIVHGLRGNGQTGNYEKPGGGFSTDDYFQWGIHPQFHPSNGSIDLFGQVMPLHSTIALAARDYYQTTTDGLADTVLNGKLRIFSFLHRSPDDSRSTLQNFLPSVSALRGNGGDFPVVSTGSGTNLSGVDALPAFSVMQRSNVVRGSNISNLVNTGDLPAEIRPAFVSSISKMISERLTSQQTQKLMGCSIKEAEDLVRAYSETLDPAADYQHLRNAVQNASLRSVVGMLFSGISSCGGASFGGYDYHGSTPTTAQNQQDRNFAIWRNTIFPVVDAAIRENKPMIIAITSDGSVRCSTSEFDISTTVNTGNNQTENLSFVVPRGEGDFGRNGCTLLIVVGELDDQLVKYHQVGHALAGGGVARDGNLIGFDSAASSSAILETIRRLSNHLNPDRKLNRTFQDASSGARISPALEEFIPVKESA